MASCVFVGFGFAFEVQISATIFFLVSSASGSRSGSLLTTENIRCSVFNDTAEQTSENHGDDIDVKDGTRHTDKKSGRQTQQKEDAMFEDRMKRGGTRS